MSETLFSAPRLVVHETFGRAGRWLAKVLRGLELPAHPTVSDERGQLLATVRRRPRLLPSRDVYGLDVLDPHGVALLSLHASFRRLTVRDPDGAELGVIDKTSRRGARELAITFAGPALPPQRRRLVAISKIEREPLGSIRPRPLLPRGAFGEIEVLDAAGAFAARAVNNDGRHDVVDISPELAGPPRALVVAFACALVDRRWLRWVPRNQP